MNTESQLKGTETSVEEPVPGRETQTVIKELLEAQCGQLKVKNSRGTVMAGRWYTSVIFTSWISASFSQ